MKKTVFEIPKMDCPSEENLIRMALRGFKDIRDLRFDLGARKLTTIHSEDPASLLRALEPLGFGARLAHSTELESHDIESISDEVKRLATDPREAQVLKQLLAINFTMFVVEIGIGWIAESTGLIADAMDMFADSTVYGVSLYAVGRALSIQRRSAQISGYMQASLAAFAMFEVIRRFIVGSEPWAPYMMVVSFFALIANVTCLILISRHRTGGMHMKASWIFSTNDVIANLGVILAGALVLFFKSPIPDLVIGAIISVVVMRGAFAILKMTRAQVVEVT
ncbi:MAG TPA: cation transporter [Bdellovibrionales bacterium]|nr:cation transporter [Bdellovibrionales bacterium]